MTTIEELQAMDQDTLVAWLFEDAERDSSQCIKVHAAVMEAAQAGELPGEFVGRWLAAQREAARRLLAEADQLERFGHCRKAGITGVHEGGKPPDRERKP